MFENYINYLNFLDEKLSKFFENQKPYICCKKGCGKCCKHSQFPYTLIEVQYLLQGVMQLPENLQDKIAKNILKILEERKEFKGEKFRYDCPFLINNECSVYNYRGIICRAFGLMTMKTNKEIQVPFCYEYGLNYANVMDETTKKVSQEKFEKLGIEEQPTAFNVSYEFLTDPDFAKGFHFDFGKRKPLIEWFINPDKDYFNLL